MLRLGRTPSYPRRELKEGTRWPMRKRAARRVSNGTEKDLWGGRIQKKGGKGNSEDAGEVLPARAGEER